MKTAKNPSKIQETIKALPDKKLAELILALKFNTKLEQSALATALAERRRRARHVKAKAAP